LSHAALHDPVPHRSLWPRGKSPRVLGLHGRGLRPRSAVVPREALHGHRRGAPEFSAASPTPLRMSVVPNEEHESAESLPMSFFAPPLPPKPRQPQQKVAHQPSAYLTRASPSPAPRAALPNCLPAPSLRDPHRSSILPEAHGFKGDIVAHQAAGPCALRPLRALDPRASRLKRPRMK
jgi:hypothetical protein